MHRIAKRKKLILENVKTNNSGEADKNRVSLARENRLDTFLRKTCFQSPPKCCACCAKARRECLTWERCLAVFRIISQQAPEIQPEGSFNCKETPSRPTNTIYPRILRKRGYNKLFVECNGP